MNLNRLRFNPFRLINDIILIEYKDGKKVYIGTYNTEHEAIEAAHNYISNMDSFLVNIPIVSLGESSNNSHYLKITYSNE